MSPSDTSPRGTGVVVIGAGILGVRTARELLTPGADGRSTTERVVLSTARRERQRQLGASFGDAVQVLCSADPAPRTGDGIGVAIVARAAGQQLDAVREVVDRGHHVVSSSDDPDEVAEILGLADRARRRGVRIVVGATMSPGLSCLLAAHAATLLDHVDELHVARHGAAGPACARQRLRALRGTAAEWRDGAWTRRPGFSGRELDWFPDPVGGLDCYRADLVEPLLLHRAFPGAQRITARLAATRRDRALAPFPVLLPPPVEGGLGAIRVELRGALGGERRSVVYGALDRPAVAGAAVAAVTALRLAAGDVEPGAGGIAELGDPVGLLRELARRGVRAAAFEGAGGGEPLSLAV
jgi:hypothetical protein